MRIAILTDTTTPATCDVGSYFALRALEQRLHGHECVRVAEPPSPELLVRLKRQDLVIILETQPLGLGKGLARHFRPEHFQEIGCPIVPLALGITGGPDARLLPEELALVRFLKSIAPQLAVRDTITRDALDDLLGPGASLLTGPLELFVREQKLSRREPRALFSPSTAAPASLQRALFEKLSRRLPSLYLAQRAGDLALGAPPGLSTLYSPRFPLVHLRAIASAESVLSFRPQVALAALAHRVPAFLVCTDDRARCTAESLGIPHLVLDDHTRAREIYDHYEKNLEAYPWEEIRRRTQVFEERLDHTLREIGISKASRVSVDVPAGKETSPPMAVCCIADWNYLPSLGGFLENLLEVCKPAPEIHFLALEPGIKEFVQRQYPGLSLKVYELEELWAANEWPAIRGRSFAHQAYASKARLLAKALTAGRGPVFYFDLDIYFFRSPASLAAAIQSHSLLLFPNWNDKLPDSKFYGLFNAGMLGVAPGAEPFLKWWGDLCLFEYRENWQHGYYVDQGFLDLVPLYFENFKIYKGCDENIAWWNLSSTVDTFQPEAAWQPGLFGKRAIGSFHAALPDRIGLHELKFAWDQITAFFSQPTWHERSRHVRSLVIQQQKTHWLSLNRLSFACATVGRVLPLSLSPTHPLLAKLFLRGPGLLLLRACAWLHYKVRALTRFLGKKPPSADTSPWVRMQKALLSSFLPLRRQQEAPARARSVGVSMSIPSSAVMT